MIVNECVTIAEWMGACASRKVGVFSRSESHLNLEQESDRVAVTVTGVTVTVAVIIKLAYHHEWSISKSSRRVRVTNKYFAIFFATFGSVHRRSSTDINKPTNLFHTKKNEIASASHHSSYFLNPTQNPCTPTHLTTTTHAFTHFSICISIAIAVTTCCPL